VERLRAGEDRRRVMSAPPVCPLDRAFGRRRPCSQGGCIYWRVPEVATECAIEQWAPAVSHQPRLAAWFERWGGER
jgi:hypothetical protein